MRSPLPLHFELPKTSNSHGQLENRDSATDFISTAFASQIMRPRSSTNRARERLSFAEAQKMVEAEMEVEELRERDRLLRDVIDSQGTLLYDVQLDRTKYLGVCSQF